MKALEGKRIVITGAGRGLGRAYALAMAQEGARIIVNDVDADMARAVAAEVTQAGGVAAASADSVSSWDGARNIVQSCITAYGDIDAIVNNAGLLHKAALLDETEPGFDRIFRTNTYGTFFCGHHAAKAMAKNRRGVILNVTSFAQAGGPDLSAYNASKGAIASLTYSWALELAPYGIRVNALSPSGSTRMTNALNTDRVTPRFYQAPEIAAPIACYLVSDYAKNVTGQVLRLYQETLQVHSHPGPWREATRQGGWTLQDIIREFPSTLGKELHPIGSGATAYQFYGGVR